jgi:hypothetical protein
VAIIIFESKAVKFSQNREIAKESAGDSLEWFARKEGFD